MTMPTAPAVNRAITPASRLQRSSSTMDTTVPGRIPQEPAVGAATILPMAALYSATATARAMARLRNAPVMPPLWA